jgi:hypothetical protein
VVPSRFKIRSLSSVSIGEQGPHFDRLSVKCNFCAKTRGASSAGEEQPMKMKKKLVEAKREEGRAIDEAGHFARRN